MNWVHIKVIDCAFGKTVYVSRLFAHISFYLNMTGIYFLLIAATVTAVFAYPGEVEINPVPQKCPVEDSKAYTVHLAHKDCSLFCKCNNGVPVVMECPDGDKGTKLHFNKVLQVCDRPAHAKCDGKGTTSGQCVGKPGGSDPVTPKPPGGVCPPGSDGETSPHECSCEKYYECQDGDQVLRKCETGKHYSKKKKRCVRSSRAGCITPDKKKFS